jgi:thioredoxin reductase
MACAIQLKRMGMDPLVIEKNQPGGMLPNANLIENYPGFPGGINGPQLAGRMIDQFNAFNIEVIKDEIHQVSYDKGVFTVKSKKEEYNCTRLVIATGTNYLVPAYCPVILIEKGSIHFDIMGLRQVTGKTIGIIGAGDAAFDYSLTLVENGNDVFIFNRGNCIKALKVLTEKVFINNRIKYLENYSLKSLELIDYKTLSAIFNSASGISSYSLDYLIFATGRIPGDSFLRESLKGKLPGLVNEHRLFLAGDVINGNCRQVSVAVGDGVKAAMEIFRNESNQ